MKNGSKTIFVRWVRSGIGFSSHQKTMIRSLGLRHLNQTIELEDTRQARGLVDCISHLVEIVEPPAKTPLSVPEFTIRAGEPVARSRQPKRKNPASASTAEAPASGEEEIGEPQISGEPEQATEGKE